MCAILLKVLTSFKNSFLCLLGQSRLYILVILFYLFQDLENGQTLKKFSQDFFFFFFLSVEGQFLSAVFKGCVEGKSKLKDIRVSSR